MVSINQSRSSSLITSFSLLKPSGNSFSLHRNLRIAVASTANDPMDSVFARGGEVLEDGFGRDRQDLLRGLKADDALGCRDGVLAVGRDEFRDLC